MPLQEHRRSRAVWRGSFVFVDDGEHYRTGEIHAEPTPGYFLVRFDSVSPGEPTSPMELVGVSEMAAPHDGSRGRRWSFFTTRDDLDRWIAWAETPSEPRMSVVRPINPRDRH